MSARLAALLACAAAGAGGCTYGPGYFPHLLPPGPIQQTHAKPGGHGYFRNFDPKAQKLDVKPGGLVNAPLGAQIVLVASVFDKDGTARRDRRVEWMLEGPGSIIEADESGVTPGRGYRLDGKFAVTHTGYVPKTFTRGNDDPKDDVPIEPGQTFIIISSAVPGETVVTAFAPAVFNRDNGLVVTKVMWGDARFKFPEPTAARVGGATTLSTHINSSATEPAGEFRVRYKFLDGPTALFVPQGGDQVALSAEGGKEKETEATPDANGEATVRLVQRDAKAGKTRVLVEVLKAPERGVGSGTVVGRREVSVEWGNPQLKLKIDSPPVASPTGTFQVTVTLDNANGVESTDARVRVTLSDGAVLARSEPPPARQDEKGALLFDLPPVTGKGKQSVTLQVRPARAGQVTIGAEAVTADDLRAQTTATTRVESGKIALVIEAPPVALAGERIPAKVAVSNGGATPVENVIVWVRVDEGLNTGSGRGPVELSAGTLAPGQTKTLDLPLNATTTGRYGIRATAAGNGDLVASADPASVEVRKAELAVAVSGSKLVYLNQELSWSVTVANRGAATLSGVIVRAVVPPEVRVIEADGGSIGAGAVEWKIPELPPGAEKSFKLEGEAGQLAPQAALTVVARGDAVSGGKAVGSPVEGRG
ncbi:MAG: DUF11 domain-containing protein, partial [Gemmataceae bacterium]|nr:DUF11 domain-containing protein [Gemmataceae bacterium]